jgi:hypothetical protein
VEGQGRVRDARREGEGGAVRRRVARTARPRRAAARIQSPQWLRCPAICS